MQPVLSAASSTLLPRLLGGVLVSAEQGTSVDVQNQYDHAVSENLHPVRRVTVGDLSADIDEELAPIIEVVWRLGLTTWTSCQNAGESNAGWPKKLPHMAPIVNAQMGWSYIDFPIDDGLTFLTALAQAGPRDAFHLRMAHWAAPDSWDVSARPMDRALTYFAGLCPELAQAASTCRTHGFPPIVTAISRRSPASVFTESNTGTTNRRRLTAQSV